MVEMTEESALVLRYFPGLNSRQQAQLAQLGPLYTEWNAKINVISRKDITHLYEHHVLHALAVAKAIAFQTGTKILDFGTGGGFPGIPLAILFPDVNFKLIDATGKKIKVVKAVAEAIGLKNVQAEHLRGEEEKGKYDFVVSRAVMPLPDLAKIVKKNILEVQHNPLPNGILCLKGGDLTDELRPFGSKAQVWDIGQWFREEWFQEEKKLVYIPIDPHVNKRNNTYRK